MHQTRYQPPLLFAVVIVLSSTITSQTVTIVADKDNTLYEHPLGSLSNGSGTGFFAGQNGGLPTVPGTHRRGLVGFDVASHIPPGSTVNSVELQLHMAQSNSLGASFSLHRVLAGWGEGASGAAGGGGAGAPAASGDATWLHRSFNTSFWAAPGGDFVAFASGTQVLGSPGFYTWASTPQMVADVQGWVNNPGTDDGWLIKGPEDGTVTAKRFDSREHLSGGYWPRLVVNVTAPANSGYAVTTGSGCLGSNLRVMALTVNGRPAIGNLSFKLEIDGGPAFAGAFMFFSTGLSPSPLTIAPNCLVHLDLPSALNFITLGVSPFGPLPLDAAGSFDFPAPLPNDPNLIAQTFDLQILAADPTVLDPGGIVLTNALTLVIGN